IVDGLCVGCDPLGRFVERIVWGMMRHVEKKRFVARFQHHPNRLSGYKVGDMTIFLDKLVVSMPGHMISRLVALGVGIDLPAEIAVGSVESVEQGTVVGSLADVPLPRKMRSIAEAAEFVRKAGIVSPHPRGG